MVKSAKRRAPAPRKTREQKLFALEALERREMLSGGGAWISISSNTAPEGATEVILMKWGDFGSQGGSINYTSGGSTPEVPRDHNLVSGSMNVGDSGQYYIDVKTNPDDQGYPEDLEDEFNPSASGYSPVNGQPSAAAGETIEETGTPTPPPPPTVCPCGNVEASVAPSTGAAIVSLATGQSPETMSYNSLDLPHPIVSATDTLSASVAQATGIGIYTVLTDLSGNVLWTSPMSGFGPGTPGEQIDATGIADGVYEATTFVIEKYGDGPPIMRGHTQFVGIDNLDGAIDPGRLGAGWMLDDTHRLWPQGGGVGLQDGFGGIDWFNVESNGVFDVPDNRTDIASLVLNQDGTYTLAYRDGHRDTFSSAGLLTSSVDRDGNTTTYAWNGDQSLASITDQSGRVTNYTYSNGLLSSITDFAGRVTSFTITNGQLMQISRPAPGYGEATPITTFGYTGNLLTGITDSGGTTTIAYNSLQQATKITNPDGTYSSYTVPAGQIVAGANVPGTVTDENGHTSSYALNSYGEPLTTTDAANTLETITQYNTSGLPTQITKHPLTGGLPDQVTQIFYDTNNNIDEEDYPDGTKAFWTNDLTWNEPTVYIDPAGRETDYTLDPANGNVLTVTQVSKTQGLANLVTHYAYTPNPTGQGQTPGGLVATMVDPRGIETDYSYNTHGLLTQVVYAKGTPDQATVSYTYDSNDNPASFTNELGAVTLTTYDNLDRLVEEQDPAPNPSQPNVRPTTTWQYDARSNIIQIVDPRGLTTTYTPSAGSDGDDPEIDKITEPDPAGGTNFTVTQFGHDNAGDVTSTTSPAGNIESVLYDADRRPTSDQLPNPAGGGAGGPTGPVVYDAFSNVAQAFDANNNETDNTFNWRGQVLTTTGPAPTVGAARPTITATYNSDGQLLTYQDALGNTTQLVYDDFGRLIKKILPDPDGSGPLLSPVLLWSYDPDGNVVSFTDANTHTYQYQYGARNELLTEIDPSPDGVAPSPTTTVQYNAALEQTQVTDPLGHVTQEQYSPNGWLIATIAPNLTTGGPGDASTTTTDGYDLDGNLISETTPTPTGATGPATTSWTLDDLNRVTLVTQPVPAPGQAAPTWQYFYNADSVLNKTIDPLGRTQTLTLDGMDRVTNETSFTGVATAWTYNNLSQIVTTTVGTGSLAETTTNTWDALGRKTAVQNAAGTTTMAFDLNGNLTKLTDPDSNATSWAFDNLNRPTSETNQLGYSRLFSYDSNSNLIQETDRDGRVRNFTFDNLNRPTAEEWMNGNTVVNTIATGYNADGQLTSAGDSFSSHAFGFDGQGHLASVDNAGTPGVPHVVLASAYDSADNRASLAATIAGVKDLLNTYSYDTLSRMTSIVQQQQTGGATVQPKEMDLAYNALGEVTSRAGYSFIGIGPRTDVTTGTFSYNTLGQLTSLKYSSDGGQNTADQFGWTYDPLGRTATFASSDGTATYGYDNVSQLVSATYTGSNQPPNVSYAFDANGNRDGTGTTVSPNNQVTNDGTFTYTFDHEGNRLTRTRISGSPANDYLTTYTWDYRNRLTDVYFYNNSSVLTQHVHYTYDAFNNMISRSLDATGSGSYSEIDYFVYDVGAPNTAADHAILEFIDPDGSGPEPAALAERFMVGPDLAGLVDQVYAQEDVATGATSWLLADNLGSTRDATDSGGTVTAHFNYSAFGQLVSGPTNVTPFLFTGEYSDPATRLQFNANRWYDPVTGTWLSPDPTDFAPGDPNLTRYALDQPTTFIDPTGLQAAAGGVPGVYPTGGTPDAVTPADINGDAPPSQTDSSGRHLSAADYQAALFAWWVAHGEPGANNAMPDPGESSSITLFGQSWVWPWDPNAGGVGQTLSAMGSAGTVAISGAASGAAAGAVTGATVGAITGTLAGPGVGTLAGATGGATAGAVGGFFSGLVSAAFENNPGDAAASGAISGALTGATGGVGAVAQKASLVSQLAKAKKAFAAIPAAEKNIISSVMKGTLPKSALNSVSKQSRQVAQNYYRAVSQLPKGSRAKQAQALNKARVNFLKGKTNTPPGTLNSSCPPKL